MRSELKQFLNLFDKTYVLTLDVAKERQANVQAQLSGADFEFFKGINKADFTIEQFVKDGVYDDIKVQSYWPDKLSISTGHIACSWGHREMYKKILDNNYGHTLIMEDDVIVRESVIEQLPSMIANMPTDADLIYWGYEAWWQWPEKNLWAAKMKSHLKLMAKKALGKKGFYYNFFPITNHTMIENMYLRRYNANFFTAGAAYATHGYSLNKKAAKILLDLQTPISLGPDTLLYYATVQGLIKSYLVVPMLLNQDRFEANSSLPNYIDYPNRDNG